MTFYNPKHDESGYFYHANIYHEVLLSYKQHLEKEHGERVCTTDPDDTTNYGALDWYSNGSMSFAEREWDQLVIRLRENVKRHTGMVLHSKDEGRGSHEHIYYFGSVIGLKGKYLSRDRIWIYRSATIEFDQKRFMEDLTRIGRWNK